jgi:hypothetical protein
VLVAAEKAFAENRPGKVDLAELLTAARSAKAQSRDAVRRSHMAQQLQWATENALFASSSTEAVAKGH